MKISEITIIPIKPSNGLVGFASCVIDDSLYLGSIGIMTKLGGGYRLTFPSKIVGSRSLNLYYPISKEFGQTFQTQIITEWEKVMKGDNVGYSSTNTNPRYVRHI